MPYFLILLLFFTTLSCKHRSEKAPNLPNIITAKELIQRSVTYHDPDGNWKNFKSSIQFNTNLWKDNGEIEKSTTQLLLNKQNEDFKIHFINNKIEFIGEVNKDTCYNKALKEVTSKTFSKYKQILNCKGAQFYKNYYLYLIGMPMKLLDPEAIVQDSVLERTYNTIKYDVIKVNYEPLNKQPVWYFYFNKKNYALELCKFTSKEDENKGGEYIIYNQEINIQNIKLKGQQVWLHNTPTLDTLVIENLQFTNN